MSETKKLGYAMERLADKYLDLVGNPISIADLEAKVTTLQTHEYMRKLRSAADNNRSFLVKSIKDLQRERDDEINYRIERKNHWNKLDMAQAVGDAIAQQLDFAY